MMYVAHVSVTHFVADTFGVTLPKNVSAGEVSVVEHLAYISNVRPRPWLCILWHWSLVVCLTALSAQLIKNVDFSLVIDKL